MDLTKETTNDVYEFTETLAKTTGIPLKVVFNAGINGYHFSFPASHLDPARLDPVFINAVRKGKNIHCTCLKLLSFNDRINESLTEVYLMSDKVIGELVDAVRARIGIMYKLSEAIALLDLLLSLASYATTTECGEW